MKIAQPYRCPSEFDAYLKGATAVANALHYDVDAKAWGGGIPTDLTLTSQFAPDDQDGPDEVPQDVYEQEAENAEIPDAATEPDSEGPSSNSEPSPSA